QWRLRDAGHGSLDHGVVGDVDRDVEDCLSTIPQPFRPAQGDIESLLALGHLSEGLAADCAFDRRLDVRNAHPPAFAPGAIDVELQVRLTHDMKDADILDAPDIAKYAPDFLGNVFELAQVRPDDLD